jgi:hypothetical protein
MRWSFNESIRRVIESAPAVVQIVLAATASFAFTHLVLGHANPIFAVTVAITSLGFTRDARPRRILSTALGMIIGIALSEAWLMADLDCALDCLDGCPLYQRLGGIRSDGGHPGDAGLHHAGS